MPQQLYRVYVDEAGDRGWGGRSTPAFVLSAVIVRDEETASFLTEALCGEPVGLDGEPDLAVICEDCDRLAREAGGDPDGWVADVADVRLELRAAA